MPASRNRSMGFISFLLCAAVFAAVPVSALAGVQFGTRLSFPTGNSPQGLAVGDPNNDRVPDVITDDYLANTVAVRIGNGDGSLQPKTDCPVGAPP